MRTLNRLVVVAVAVAGLAAPLQAQRLYRFEAGAAGAYNSFGKSTELAGSVGGVGRVGYWLWRKFSLEVEGGVAVPKADNGSQVNVVTFSGAGLYNLPLGLYSTAYFKGGFGSVGFGSCPDSIAPSTICGSSSAILAGLGGRLALSPTLMLRAELLMSNSSSPSFSNFAISAGLTYMLASQPLPDSDEDGVYDRYDRCAETPLGAIADKNGCPTDTDNDTVVDGLDRCPNSPPGSAVDTAGCPKDTDRDNVLDGLDRCEETPSGATVDANGCPGDSDGDKVFDGLDRCPTTPQGATVDRLGCPGDKDNDRVFDGIDRCPDTPPGTTVNAFGCPPVIDSDRDGVHDSVDRCPNTAVGVRVDANGCPVAPDSDGDGSPDSGDLCPGTPAGTRVDVYGCPLTPVPPRTPGADTTPRRDPPPPVTSARWTIPGNGFPVRSAVIRPAVLPLLDSIAAVLIADPTIRVEIAGNAQDRLPPLDNLKLSTDRAQAIRLYLLQKGVRGTQLTIKGYGALNLITQDSSDIARVHNRRTEIRVISGP